MPQFLTALLALLTACLGAGTVLYLPFARSPEKQWRDRVRRLLTAARRQIAIEGRTLQQSTARLQAEEVTLRDRAWITFLDTVSVEQLDDYPGIGPATLAKLRSAGFTTLSMFQHSRLHLPGLGAKRLADIDRAVRELTQQCRSRFTAGACPESQELAERLKTLRSNFQEREAQARARLQAAEAFSKSLGPLADLSEAVTVWNYWRSPRGTLVPAEIINVPLPDLDQAVAAAAQPSAHAMPTPPRLPLPEAKPASRAELAVVLQLDSGDSLTPDAVRRQYNLLSERYDPDKLQILGPEFMELARSKQAAVQAAAEALLAQLGTKLEQPAAPVHQDLRENPDLDAILGG
jgi:hypothetical protein